MANYIKKNILCQAYLHVEVADDFDVENLREQLQEFCKTRAGFFFYEDVEIDISFEPGSLRAKITVLGLVGFLLHGVSSLMDSVAKYPSFREGVIQITQDAKRLADYIGSEGLFLTQSKQEAVIRIEGRMGIIGSLQRIIYQLEDLERGNGRLSEYEMTKKIQSTRKDVERLLANIQGTDDEPYLLQQLNVLAENLPSTPKTPSKNAPDRLHIALYKSELQRMLQRLSEKQKP